ncbi:MAG: hypothetical protein JJ899_05595 [Alphaproteobacteria bacterium]|nr:hypothetical protein [Alphaproteobacteria bacterium]
MPQTRKFLFDNDFAHPEETRKQAAVYTEDEMAAAEAKAFEAGRQAMAEEQHVTEEQFLTQLVERMSGQVETLIAQRQSSADDAVREAGQLAITICRKVLPTLAAQNALTEIEGLVVRTIAEMHEEPRLVLRVSDSKLDELQTRFERMTAAFAGKVVLLGDDELAPTDCAVLWADGGEERDFSRLWTELENTVSALTDGRTSPDLPSPLDGLPDPDAFAGTPEPAQLAPGMPTEAVVTETANQESGHG